MFALVIALQAAAAPPPPDAPAPPPWTPPPASAPPAQPWTPPPQPSGPAQLPVGQPVIGQPSHELPPPAYPPAAPYAPAAPPPSEREEVSIFGRFEIGVGPQGFAHQTTLLRAAGYEGAKLWATFDGAYMVHPRIGVGLWAGMNRFAVHPLSGPDLNETAYFAAAQAPIHILGDRRLYALHVTPRIGYLGGQIDFRSGGAAPWRHTAIYGGAVSFLSFRYHVGASISFMRAQVEPTGELGGAHDHGGLYFALGGTIDG